MAAGVPLLGVGRVYFFGRFLSTSKGETDFDQSNDSILRLF